MLLKRAPHTPQPGVLQRGSSGNLPRTASAHAPTGVLVDGNRQLEQTHSIPAGPRSSTEAPGAPQAWQADGMSSHTGALLLKGLWFTLVAVSGTDDEQAAQRTIWCVWAWGWGGKPITLKGCLSWARGEGQGVGALQQDAARVHAAGSWSSTLAVAGFENMVSACACHSL
eukprot:364595-Chlamydomonas_euryale.AAC.17